MPADKIQAQIDMATEFMALFEGRMDVHGQYDLPGSKTAGKKVAGKAWLSKKPLEVDLWIKHLKGEQGLGVMMAKENKKCHFAAIDIDKYSLPDEAQSKLLEDLSHTPLVPCRSKSGGFHIYIFFKSATSCAMALKSMTRIAEQLGHGGSEVFPKAITTGDYPGGWINMPYFGGRDTDRYAINTITAKPLSLRQFLNLAVKNQITAPQLKSLKVQEEAIDESYIPNGPPCLQYLTTYGFPNGSRNHGLFNLAVYYKRAIPDEWESRVETANKKWMSPGSRQEVQNILVSMRKKDYVYKCEEEPVSSHCNKDACLNRRFGVGLNLEADMPAITHLVKITSDPPQYFVDVAGMRVGPLASTELLTQCYFQRRVFERLGVVIPTLKAQRWRAVVNELHQEVHELEVPDDSSASGQLFNLMTDFMASKATDIRNEVIVGRAWVDKEGHHHFRMQDLLEFVQRRGFTAMNLNQIAAILRNVYELESTQLKIQGNVVRVWKTTDVSKVTGAPRIEGRSFKKPDF